jgi:hypothetical protein
MLFCFLSFDDFVLVVVISFHSYQQNPKHLQLKVDVLHLLRCPNSSLQNEAKPKFIGDTQSYLACYFWSFIAD